MKREFKSDREAFWYGIRDGLLFILVSGIVGLGLTLAFIL